MGVVLYGGFLVTLEIELKMQVGILKTSKKRTKSQKTPHFLNKKRKKRKKSYKTTRFVVCFL